MIAIARQKLVDQPVQQLSFAVADADEPLAGQGDYDAVLAFNLLHLVDDLDRALQLAVRALRPGGLLISKTACISEMNPLIPWLAIPVMRAIGKAPHVLCFDAKALKAAIVRQGMVIESVERHGTRGKDIRVFIVARKVSQVCNPKTGSRWLSSSNERAPDAKAEMALPAPATQPTAAPTPHPR
jgi:ubiquinone/menaquinone biosynthesis C-methylase UbiE